MIAAVLILLALAAAAIFAALWQRAERVAAERLGQRNHATERAAGYRREVISLSAECGRLRARVAELRDDHDLLTQNPSLTAEWTAFINQWPVINRREGQR